MTGGCEGVQTDSNSLEAILTSKGLPADVSTEKNILGAVMLNNDLLEPLAEILEVDDFFLESHRLIFKVICSLRRQQMPVEFTFILDALRSKNWLERANGAAYVSSLIDGVPRIDSIEYYANLVKEKSIERRTIRALHQAAMQIAEGEDLQFALVEVDQAITLARSFSTGLNKMSGFYTSLLDFNKAKIQENELILSCLRRGEVAQLAAITNLGKSTLLLNVCLSLTAGLSFFHLVTEGVPRRVLYCDFESPASRLRDDINTMRSTMLNCGLTDENLAVIVDAEIDEQSLNLSRKAHLQRLRSIARQFKPDLLLLDTMSAGFDIQDENSNAEITRIMKSLRKLARELSCAVIFAHHIGKATETQNTEGSYRARGASAFGGMAHTTLNLEKDATKGDGYAILSCTKSKGNKFSPVLLRLNFATRWFERCEEMPAVKPMLTAKEIAMFVELKGKALTKEICEQFSSAASERTIKERISQAEALNLIAKLQGKKGIWTAAKSSCNGQKSEIDKTDRN